MFSRQFFGLAVVITLLLGPQAGICQEPADTETTYFYSQGKKIAVRVANDRVAVRLREGTQARSLMGRDARFRIEPDKEFVEFPDQRITILPLSEAMPRDQFMEMTRFLATDNAVELVGTVVLTEDSDTPLIMTDQIVVRFKEDVAGQQREDLYRNYGVEVIRESQSRPGRVVLRLLPDSEKNALEAANGIYESGLVTFAHPNFYAKTVRRTLPNQPFRPNDPLFDEQWHLDNDGRDGGTVDADVDAPEAWDFTRGDAGIVIGILDDGIDVDHEDLAPNVVPGGRDFTANPPDNDPRPETGNSHGTATSGVAVARGHNNLGGSGGCPQCGLLPIRMLGGSISDHADAIDYASAQGAAILSNSWGYSIGTPTTDDVVDAIDNAAANGRGGLGTVIFFAMNNGNVNDCTGGTPDISSLNSVIAVSASTNQDRKVVQSGFGNCMDILAPTHRGYSAADPFTGTLNITTTDRTGNVGYNNASARANCPESELGNRRYTNCFGGTSSATPLSAGVGGLLLSINPNLTRVQVQEILQETAEKIEPGEANYDADGFSNTHGYGRISAHRALVPTVKISAPSSVRRNTPFSVKVTASAPHGLTTLWWFGQGTGIPSLDQAHMQNVTGGDPVVIHTWNNITIGQKGTYTLGANARDILYPNPGDGYPHQASEGSGIDTTQIRVTPLGSKLGLLMLFAMFALSGKAFTRKWSFSRSA